MDLELAGRTALVTGASVGIGRGIAKVLAGEGVRLAVVARRSQLLEELAAELAAGNERPCPITADLTEPDAPARIVEAATAALGPIDILINNAGASMPGSWDVGDEVWDASLALNFTAGRRLTQALVPAMRERRWGRIVNITGNMEVVGANAAIPAKAAITSLGEGVVARTWARRHHRQLRHPRAHHERADRRTPDARPGRARGIRAHRNPRRLYRRT